MEISDNDPRLLRVGDLVMFNRNSVQEVGLVELISHRRGMTWIYVEWENGDQSSAWYPCLPEELDIVEKSGD